MNWKTYKTLTPEEKEEYNYRFKDKTTQFNLIGPTRLGSVFIGLGLITAMLFYVTYTSPALEDNKESILVFFESINNVLKLSTSIIIFSLVINVIFLIIHHVSYYIWKKKNKIDYIPFWRKE